MEMTQSSGVRFFGGISRAGLRLAVSVCQKEIDGAIIRQSHAGNRIARLIFRHRKIDSVFQIGIQTRPQRATRFTVRIGRHDRRAICRIAPNPIDDELHTNGRRAIRPGCFKVNVVVIAGLPWVLKCHGRDPPRVRCIDQLQSHTQIVQARIPLHAGRRRRGRHGHRDAQVLSGMIDENYMQVKSSSLYESDDLGSVGGDALSIQGHFTRFIDVPHER